MNDICLYIASYVKYASHEATFGLDAARKLEFLGKIQHWQRGGVTAIIALRQWSPASRGPSTLVVPAVGSRKFRWYYSAGNERPFSQIRLKAASVSFTWDHLGILSGRDTAQLAQVRTPEASCVPSTDGQVPAEQFGAESCRPNRARINRCHGFHGGFIMFYLYPYAILQPKPGDT